MACSHFLVILEFLTRLKCKYEYFLRESMDTQKGQSEKQSLPTTNPSVVTSCRKKKNEEATFLEDLKDHIDEFIHASMDEHKTCFKNTVQKMFGLSKVVAEQNANAAREVESSLHLQTTVQD
ncbi:hypothetical protein AAHE18_16G225200 [Arachis hypogaea]